MINQLDVHWKAKLANAGMETQTFMDEWIYQVKALVLSWRVNWLKLVLSQIISYFLSG